MSPGVVLLVRPMGIFTRTFHHPQGMALDGNILYVADTENHLLRRLDLQARTVTTIAGTGAQARSVNVPGTGTEVAQLPWDLALIGTQLFIAMAGSHQVWVMNLETASLEPMPAVGGRTSSTPRAGKPPWRSRVASPPMARSCTWRTVRRVRSVLSALASMAWA